MDDLERLDEEEAALALRQFNADDAWWLGCRLRNNARSMDAPIAIEITRQTTHLFSCLLPGATADNLAWIARKRAVVERFERSSYTVGLMLKAGDNLFARFGLDPSRHAAAGGAVPIRIVGSGMVGVAAVSGLKQDVDHGLVIDALSALKAYQG